MGLYDAGVMAPFVLAAGLWARALWRGNRADGIAAGALAAVGVGLYIAFFSATRVEWLASIGAVLCAVAGGATVLAHRGAKARLAVGVLVPLAVAGLLAAAEAKWAAPPNALLVLEPYRHAGTWVFDDPRVGLRAEPFIAGIPEIIDRLVADAGIANADAGFRLIFSARPFPGHQIRVVRRRAESGGNWYYAPDYGMEGWLCPALFKYYRRAPHALYVKAEAKVGGR